MRFSWKSTVRSYEQCTDKLEWNQTNMISDEQLKAVEECFTYHAPTLEDIEKYKMIRETAKTLVKVFLVFCPPSADRTYAIRLVRQAVMTANQSIATKGTNIV